jgi:AraC-like DNA-binding protein
MVRSVGDGPVAFGAAAGKFWRRWLMKISVFQPQHPLLAKYIECIYTLKQTGQEKPAKYLTFPSIFSIVAASENSQSTTQGNTLRITHRSSRSIETNLAVNFNQPVFVEYQGPINEVTVYFKPLGINAFLPTDLASFSGGMFSEFVPFADYQPALASILALSNDEEKIAALEQYWLTKFRGFSDPLLERAVAELSTDPGVTISDLAKTAGTSRATLNHHFRRHLGKTPSQFRKILRFRSALKQHESLNSKSPLTEITYALDYFDQSHMVKDFRALTGYSPKRFFSEVTDIEGGQIVWLFL